MKIIHVLKRIETIDHDIKDLRKLEKILQKDKSFTTPIYMSIEKQINIMLGERVKLLELEIANPPENLANEIQGSDKEAAKPVKSKTVKTKKAHKKAEASDDDDDFTIPMLTQDQIDKKMKEMPKSEKKAASKENQEDDKDENVKLLDIALQKGTLKKSDVEEEKKKVRFFRDNFPGY